MPHNDVHREITNLDKVRRTLDGEPVLDQGSEIISALMEGDKERARGLLFNQFIEFDDMHADKRNEAQQIGVDLAEALIKHVGRI